MKPARPIRAKTTTAARGVLGTALVWLTLVAFALSGFITSTHIHYTAVPGSPAQIDPVDGAKVPGKAPAKDDESSCPICQAFASAGHFVTPAVAATLAPSVVVSVITLAIQTSHLVPQVTHIWRGRAPPRTSSH